MAGQCCFGEERFGEVGADELGFALVVDPSAIDNVEEAVGDADNVEGACSVVIALVDFVADVVGAENINALPGEFVGDVVMAGEDTDDVVILYRAP